MGFGAENVRTRQMTNRRWLAARCRSYLAEERGL
jgi:hypothetical protein